MPADLTPEPPRTADDMLELIAKPVFGAGLNWAVVEHAWPATREAFERFSVRKVAAYQEADVRRILATPGVIQNERKIQSVVACARQLAEKGRRHGSVRKWIHTHPDHTARLAALDDLPGVGPWGAYYVVAKSGFPVPAWRP